MTVAKLSSKNQIVVPKEVRSALGIKPGDKLILVVHGKSASLMPEPKDHMKAVKAIGRGLYPPGYLEEERKAWNE